MTPEKEEDILVVEKDDVVEEEDEAEEEERENLIVSCYRQFQVMTHRDISVVRSVANHQRVLPIFCLTVVTLNPPETTPPLFLRQLLLKPCRQLVHDGNSLL